MHPINLGGANLARSYPQDPNGATSCGPQTANAQTCAATELERLGKVAVEGFRQIEQLASLVDVLEVMVHGPKPSHAKPCDDAPVPMPLGLSDLRNSFERLQGSRDSHLNRLATLLGVNR